MTFNVTEILSSGLINGGARPTLFDVQMVLPQSVLVNSSRAENRLRFTCRAASIPASTLNSINVPYFGRMVKVAGDREFADWTVTIMNDEDYVVRKAMESWSNSINTLEGNVRSIPQGDGSTGMPTSSGYKTNATINAYGKNSTRINAYNLVGLFPISVDAMDMDWEDTNKIQTFNVTFAYDYWVPVPTITPKGLQGDTPVSTPYNVLTGL
jgi:hypothetical protein